MSLWLRLQDRFQAHLRGPDLPRLKELLGAKAGERVLDLGGGTGLVAERLAGPAEVTVVEPDAAKIAYGALRRRGLRFVEGSAERLPFPDGYFDRAMMLLSFHHIPDQEAALREVRRVLRPGGLLLVQELDPTTQPGHFVHWFENRLLHQECHFHAGEDLPPLLKRAGFEVGAPERAVRGYFLVARRP